MKNAKSFFVIEKIQKYRKCPALQRALTDFSTSSGRHLRAGRLQPRAAARGPRGARQAHLGEGAQRRLHTYTGQQAGRHASDATAAVAVANPPPPPN